MSSRVLSPAGGCDQAHNLAPVIAEPPDGINSSFPAPLHRLRWEKWYRRPEQSERAGSCAARRAGQDNCASPHWIGVSGKGHPFIDN